MATEMFDEFRKKEKFVEEKGALYTGLANANLKSIFTEKINLAADDFQQVANRPSPTEQEYHAAIDKGLSRFMDVYLDLDTEDRERVCSYFEELMDIVGLESSGGRLNKFMYGFDPE